MHASQYPAGTTWRAGLGVSTVLADIDFETASEAGYFWLPDSKAWAGPEGSTKKGLPAVGLAVYATHPSTRVLSLAYNLKDGTGSHLWKPSMSAPPAALIDHVQRGALVEAWNSGFEWWIWNFVCRRAYGWPPMYVQQMRCAMAKARASGWPGALGNAGAVMGLQVQKDKVGDSMLKLFSMPQKPTKAQPLKWLDPEAHPDGPKLYHYNEVDIVTEAEASSRVPDLEGFELDYWVLDQTINRRGVAADVEGLKACASIVTQCLARYDAELLALTGGVVERASQLQRLKGWLAGQGVQMGTMDDEAIEAALKRIPPDPPGRVVPARRALQLRQLTGSASVKKVFTMLNMVSPFGRLHELFIYHGARTGRPTGADVQPTNMPKSGPKVRKCACGKWHGAALQACPWCGARCVPLPPKAKTGWTWKAVNDVLEVLRSGSLDLVEMYFGDAMLCVSGVLRSLFVAAPGCDLIASDFSAIESVVTAVLAGEDWRVDMFKTHGKNYEMAAAQISGTSFAEMMAHAGYDVSQPEWWKQDATGEHHPLRQTLGKVSELASGFGGWIGAWVKFGADEFMSEDEIKRAILAWRDASPAIVEFWGGQQRRDGHWTIPEFYGLEGMAINAVRNRGISYPVMRKDGTHTGITYLADAEALYCILPSGRRLTYRNPGLEPSDRWNCEYSLYFEGWNSNPLKGAIGWQRMYLYGGLLCENVVQAVAGDLQRCAKLRVEAAGYPVVLHVYDEIVAEVTSGTRSIEEFEALMQQAPPWAVYKGEPWPIKAAGGWRSDRYRKG